MATGATYSVRYRRKRQKRTDYKRRLNLLKSGIARFVSRPTNKHIITQIIQYSPESDMVVAQANSGELIKYGWNHCTSNIPAAYLTGLLCAVKAKEAGVKEAILDTGLYPQVNGSRMYSSLKGLIDGGVSSNASEDIFPDEERLQGAHIAAYLDRSKSIVEDFKKTKNKILETGK